MIYVDCLNEIKVFDRAHTELELIFLRCVAARKKVDE